MKITKDQAIELLLKEHIRRMLKEGEAGTPEEPEVEPEVEVEPEAEVEPEVEPEAEVEPEEEEDSNEEIIDLTDMFIRKLRTSYSADEDDVVEIVGRMFDAFKYGNATKLEVLKKIKEETIT